MPPAQANDCDRRASGPSRAERFRDMRTAVLAAAFALAVLFAFSGWRQDGVVGALLGVFGAVIAVPVALGVLWLIVRPGRDRSREGGA